jgi:hypothetical protein
LENSIGKWHRKRRWKIVLENFAGKQHWKMVSENVVGK